MGCCIPRKQCISLVTINKKNSKKIITKNAKTFDSSHSIGKINKYLGSIILQKYYLPFPNQDMNISISSNTFLFPPRNKTYDIEKNKKKIRASMKKLKEISTLEVNNCQKFFIKQKK